jgi:transcription termination/antitermination protein NusG
VQITAGELETPRQEPHEPWYAVYTKHQHEKTAARLLERTGFEIFLPLYQTVHRWKDRNQKVQLPLFPCYLFLRTGFDRKIDVLRTPGVFSFIESGGRPCAIPDDEIDAIRRAANSPAHFEPHPFLKSGDRVRIRSGPLAGIEGILTGTRKRYRIVLSVELLQKSVGVEVDLAIVERIGPQSPGSSSSEKDTATGTFAGEGNVNRRHRG